MDLWTGILTVDDHVIWQREMLTNLKPSKGQVTFGDGVKGRILGSRTLYFPGKIKLDNVLLVQGLWANILNISQLCDEGWKVNFNHNLCLVKDQANNCVMEGKKVFRKVLYSNKWYFMFSCQLGFNKSVASTTWPHEPDRSTTLMFSRSSTRSAKVKV